MVDTLKAVADVARGGTAIIAATRSVIINLIEKGK